MTAQDLFEKVIAKAKEFGMNPKNDGRTIIDPKGNTVVRNNLLDISFTDGSAYFGFLSTDEETAGPYSDFSFVVFPEKELKYCAIALCVGSSGFKNDYQLASLPGLRRTIHITEYEYPIDHRGHSTTLNQILLYQRLLNSMLLMQNTRVMSIIGMNQAMNSKTHSDMIYTRYLLTVHSIK